jgi:hypothetical protein
VETDATRILAVLGAAPSMHLNVHDREEPFGPLISSSDRRTAIPADFGGEPVKLLADMAERAANPVLKARLADICWLLERKRGALAGWPSLTMSTPSRRSSSEPSNSPSPITMARSIRRARSAGARFAYRPGDRLDQARDRSRVRCRRSPPGAGRDAAAGGAADLVRRTRSRLRRVRSASGCGRHRGGVGDRGCRFSCPHLALASGRARLPCGKAGP